MVIMAAGGGKQPQNIPFSSRLDRTPGPKKPVTSNGIKESHETFSYRGHRAIGSAYCGGIGRGMATERHSPRARHPYSCADGRRHSHASSHDFSVARPYRNSDRRSQSSFDRGPRPCAGSG